MNLIFGNPSMTTPNLAQLLIPCITHVNTQWHSQKNPKPTNSMKQRSSWDATSSSAGQEILHILWNPKVRYNIHKHVPPVPILSLINPNHAIPSHLLKINFDILSHIYLGLLNSPFPSGLSTNILHAPLLSPIHATCPTHLILPYKTQHNLNSFLFQLNFSIVMLHPVAW